MKLINLEKRNDEIGSVCKVNSDDSADAILEEDAQQSFDFKDFSESLDTIETSTEAENNTDEDIQNNAEQNNSELDNE